MESQEKRPELKASMMELQLEKGNSNNYFKGEANVDKSSPIETDGVVEIEVKGFSNINDLPADKRKLALDNFGRRMTSWAMQVRADKNRESDERNKKVKVINEGPSK